jgi:uncharacterized protein (DUF1501 family)
MLTLPGTPANLCSGPTRRDFLRAGALGLAGLTLADVLRADTRAKAARPKSIIYIVLDGGPSHLDMWDPKPDAPAEVRGPFQTIRTALPGVLFSEYLPKQARMLGRLALVRGVKSVENDHFLSEVYSGLPRTAGQRPAFGSVVSRLQKGAAGIPAYVSLNRATTDQFEFEKPYYAGAAHAPFRPFGEAVENLKPAKSLDRLQDRKKLLRAFDTLRRDIDQSGTFDGLDKFNRQALSILTSPRVRDAFDLSREPNRVAERYRSGKYQYISLKEAVFTWDSRPLLLARRLVEAGVRVVTLRVGSWDHHGGFPNGIFNSLKTMLPLMDDSVTTLLDDLRDRGLDKDVLVVVLGEFGRTPKITPAGPGREHWADAGCVIFAGGGLKMGQVIGETDRNGERARSGAVTMQSVMATIYRVMGIDPEARLNDFRGRPQHLLDEREPIAELDPPGVARRDA